MTDTALQTQLELDFSCETPICVEAVPTATASTAHPHSPTPNKNCTHPQLSLGLDRAYCPDCKIEFHPWQKEYKGALEPQPQEELPWQQWNIGDRVTLLSESPASLWQILKVADGHATVERIGESNTSSNRRRVALWKLRPSCAIATGDAQAEQLPDERPPAEVAPDKPAPASSLVTTPRENLCKSGQGLNKTDLLCRRDYSNGPCPDLHRFVVTPESLSGADANKPDCVLVSRPPAEVAPDKHWVETYSPAKRIDSYYRYVWMSGRKLNHIHIRGGHSKSALALARKAEIESAIRVGQSPLEIKQMIKSWSCSRS